LDEINLLEFMNHMYFKYYPRKSREDEERMIAKNDDL
jgi:hypothetical protein